MSNKDGGNMAVMKISKVKRGDEIFKVLQQTDNEVRVSEGWWRKHGFPYWFIMKSWWLLSDCEAIQYKCSKNWIKIK